jgi:hypothetical protein
MRVLSWGVSTGMPCAVALVVKQEDTGPPAAVVVAYPVTKR